MKEQLTIQHHQYAESQQQNHFLHQSYTELEKRHHHIVSENESLKANINQLEKTNIENQHTSQHWQQQYKEFEKKLEAKMRELISLQSDNRMLNQQLIDTKQLVHNTQDQNKLLVTEKWELAQEKAQLEGQLKQMQMIVCEERIK